MNGLGRGGDNQKNETKILTRETLGVTFMLFSVLLLVILSIGQYIFGDIGLAITAFFLGLFGYFVYPLLLGAIYGSYVLVSGKKPLSAKWFLRIFALLTTIFMTVHLATAHAYENGYGAYLGSCYTAASENAGAATGGGVIFGLIAYPLHAVLSEVGAYIVTVLFMALSLLLILHATPLKTVLRKNRAPLQRTAENPESGREPASSFRFDDLEERRTPAPLEIPTPQPVRADLAPAERPSAPVGRDILYGSDPVENYRNNLIYNGNSAFNRPRRSTLEPQERAFPTSYRENYGDGQPHESLPRKVVQAKAQESNPYTLRTEELNYRQIPSYRAPEAPEEAEEHDYYTNDVPMEDFSSAPNVDDVDYDIPEEDVPPAEPVQPAESLRRGEDVPPAAPVRPAESLRRGEDVPPAAPVRPAESLRRGEDVPPAAPVRPAESLRRGEDVPPAEPVPSEAMRSASRFGSSETFGRFSGDRFAADERFSDADGPQETSRAIEGLERASGADIFDDDEVEFEEPEVPVRRAPRPRTEKAVASEKPAPPPRVFRPYRYPNYDHFERHDDHVVIPTDEIKRNVEIIEETMRGFHVEVTYRGCESGPTVTRYDFDIPRNVPIRAVTKHDEEIAMRLHATDGVNIYSNNAGGVISVEVPNSVRAIVGIRNIMESPDFQRNDPHALYFVLGKDVNNKCVCGNVTKMTHILVAGATNSGKSVCLNTMIVSLICKYSPEDLRLILIDPKKTELAVYSGLPHLMINEIISDAQKAVSALNWAIKEMERRYELFEQKTYGGAPVRNIDEYNEDRKEEEEKLPKILIVFDELADFMNVAKKDIEERIQRITQKARAAGIHLVVATQRPSTDVITGVVKGNLPTRIAFRVVTEVDSRVIMDETGAEKLLGNGDMLYKSAGMYNPVRVQGAFLSTREVMSVVSEIKSSNEAYFDNDVSDYINRTSGSDAGGSDDGDLDGDSISQEYIKALSISVKLGTTSISLIQRKCSVGYNHAGKIIEWMELMGYITPFDGKAKARTVLLTKEEFEERYGSLD